MFNEPLDTSSYPRRAARVAFGCVLLAGVAALLFLRHIPRATLPPEYFRRWAPTVGGGAFAIPTWIFVLATWVAAFVAARGARAIAMPMADVGDRLLIASLAVPGIGIALLLPITLHLPFLAAFGSVATFAERYDDWIDLSLRLVGPAHVVLAVLVALRARDLARPSGHALADPSSRLTPWRIYWLTVAASLVPGALTYGISTAVVAVTGVAIAPLLLLIPAIVERERAATPILPGARMVLA
jgi:hypothetical protein